MRTKLALASLALLTTIWTTGCADQTRAIDTSCSAFEPIYLSEQAIAALRPYRAERQAIAEHNAAWERLCPVSSERP